MAVVNGFLRARIYTALQKTIKNRAAGLNFTPKCRAAHADALRLWRAGWSGLSVRSVRHEPLALPVSHRESCAAAIPMPPRERKNRRHAFLSLQHLVSGFAAALRGLRPQSAAFPLRNRTCRLNSLRRHHKQCNLRPENCFSGIGCLQGGCLCGRLKPINSQARTTCFAKSVRNRLQKSIATLAS
jgi:hypothetical protein